jgi:hypothetical protein
MKCGEDRHLGISFFGVGILFMRGMNWIYAWVLYIYAFRNSLDTSIILQRSLLPKERHDITLSRSFASLGLGNIDCGLLLRHRLILGERLPGCFFPGNCNRLVHLGK